MEQITNRFMNWASIIEANTFDQAKMTSEMPFIFPHLALMPDAHLWRRYRKQYAGKNTSADPTPEG